MQLVGKLVGIFAGERLGAGGEFSALSDTLHQVSHRQVLLDIVYRVELTSVVNGMGIFGDDAVGKRDIRSDHKVSCAAQLHDMVVRLIGALFYDEILDMSGAADVDLFVGDDLGGEAEPLYASQNDRLEEIGEGIAVYKERHTRVSLSLFPPRLY